MESGERAPVPPETPTNVAGDNVESSEKRKRQPRNSACQPCASLKMKCVSSEDGGKCERCHRMNRECIPAIPKPRKRKTEDVGFDSPSGVPISTFLNGNTAATSSAADAARSVTLARPTLEPATPTMTLMTKPDIRHNESRSFAALFAQALGLGALTQGLVIDYNFVNNSFTIFRQFAAHFPFVHTFISADAVAMVAHRPFTSAAVCTVSSSANTSMQERLSGMFRFALSTKALVEGERSVDMMIGLLIYLAWHHHYISKSRVYQDLCLLAGMAADLGVYQQSPETALADVNLALERDRGFLGVYHLCSSLSRKGLNRPSPLRWTDKLREYAESVSRSGVLSSDQGLVPMLELTHILEDLEDGLVLDADLKRSTMSYACELHAKSASSRLKALKREYPTLSNDPAFSAAVIDVHYKLMSASETSDTSELIQCACLIKEYLDDILSRPPIMLHQIAISDWTNLLSVLMMLGNVSKPPPNSTGWEAGALTSMLQPATVLDALCGQMASPAPDPLTPRHEILLQGFRSFCEPIKRLVAEGAASAPDQSLSNEANGVHLGSITESGILNKFMRVR